MAARMQFVIRDFALHPNRTEFRFERSANRAGQLSDSENFLCLREEIAGKLRGHVVKALEALES